MAIFKGLLGPVIFRIVNIKKGPAITLVLHTAWAHALWLQLLLFLNCTSFGFCQLFNMNNVSASKGMFDILFHQIALPKEELNALKTF